MYQLGTSSHGSSYFHDVVCGNTASPTGGPDGDAAGAGWDPATGWGELDWFNYSTGYAIALGATNLSQPASLANGYAYSCAKTPTNASERAISMPTTSVGYSVGSASSSPWPGKFLASGSWGPSNNFLKTTDGGLTWQADNADMMSIACTSATTCIEVGDGGRIRRTTDGGTTWTYVDSPDNKALTSIACPTPSICYAAGDRGAVLKSADAGASWAYVSTADGNPLYGLACPSATICYAVDSYAHVEKTIDGGASWTLETTPVTTPGQDVPGSGGPNPFAGLFAITCTSINSCVAVGGFPPVGTDPPIVTTTDGGNTWTLRTSNAGAGNYLNGVACVGSTCYADGRAGAIVTSVDGGVTWSAMTSNTTSQLTGVACTDASDCVATGQSGTVDVLGGGTWTPTTGLAQSLFLASVVCRSATDCVAAGKQGATLAFDSTNVAGSASLQAGGGTTQQMNGISCSDASDCVAVGNAGTVLTTSNGGQTWLPRTSSTASSLSGVSCVGSACKAVGASGTIVASPNGGAIWVPQTSGTASNLNGISCRSTSSCVAVGNSGTVVRTTSGGSLWTAQTSGTGANLSAVACPSSDCYAVGAIPGGGTTATILASTDGGATWSAQTSNAPQALSAVACSSDVACFAGGTIGTIVTTVDGGANWTQQGDPISGPTSAPNAGPVGITAIFAATCTSARCLFGTASAGDVMVTPLLTVTVSATGTYNETPPLAGVSPSDPSISYSPAGEAGNVTGSLTCSTTATMTSDPGSYPVSECGGLSDPGYSVVYDLDDSSYTVAQADQTITFAPPPTKTIGDPDFQVTATSTSNLPVTIAQTFGPCTVIGTESPVTVHLTGVGQCVLTASQAGNVDYAAANDVPGTIDVADTTNTLAVSKTGTGSGTVTSAPAGISCGSTCSAAFDTGSQVTLTATATAGSVFAGWSGAGCSGTGTCQAAMNGDQAVTATFATAPPVTHTLTVSRSGTGSGTVTSSPAGISCGSTCSDAFAAGTQVTLSATAAAGSVFAGWGGGCSGTGTCVVTLGGDTTVTATFTAMPPPPSCRVPKVTGKRLAAAKAAITHAHCAVGKVTTVFSARVKKGRVVSQRPAPGTTLAARSKVRLTVSRGPKPMHKKKKKR